MHPHVKQFRRFHVRHIPVSVYLRFKATCRTTIPCRSVLRGVPELLAEFSASEYMTDTYLSRFKWILKLVNPEK